MPDDVRAEIDGLWAERDSLVARDSYPLRLASRRNRHRFNSMGFTQPRIHRLTPYNPAYMNPDDMARLGISGGETVRVVSADGAIPAIAEADEAVRPGVVSMSHGFGGLPDEGPDADGAICINQLTSCDRERQTINAMPRMTAIPVRVEPLGR